MLVAAQHVGNEPFAVLLGDDLIDERDPLLSRMVEVQERLGGSVIALIEVDPSQIHLYGCAAVAATDEEDVVLITDLVEKPKTNAPSNLAHHRPVRDRAGGLRRAARDTSRGRRRDPAHRRIAGARRPLCRTVGRCTACCSAAVDTTPVTVPTTCAR